MACKQDLAASLRAYCNGDVQALAAVPIALMETSLQHVWTLVRGIAAGNVTTDAALAPEFGMAPTETASANALAGDDSVQMVCFPRVIAC